MEETRQVPILTLVDDGDKKRLVKGLEIGVNDYLLRPIDRNELLARSRTQIRRKRYTDYLRDNLDHSLELAVTDQLTGLHNRRYMASQLDALTRRAAVGGDPVALLVIDIDHFKKINDSFGHAVGDEVIRSLAQLMRDGSRPSDVLCRNGGEEFLMLLPAAGAREAGNVAERLRRRVQAQQLPGVGAITISAGVVEVGPGETVRDAIARADTELYRAKRTGRNRIQTPLTDPTSDQEQSDSNRI